MQSRLALLMALAVASVALAGCSQGGSDGGDGNDDSSGTSGAGTASEGLAAPTWAIGDRWEYRDSGGNQLGLIVSGDEGSDWRVDTDHEQLAFFDAVFGPISYLGQIRKADLAGSQTGGRVQYFDFPLQDGKSWSTSWDGERMQVTAYANSDGSYRMEAKTGDVVRNEYQYSNETRFFDWISFRDAAGNENFRMDLVSTERGWTGEALRIDATLAFNDTGAGPNVASETFDPSGADTVWASVFVQCEQGAGVVAVGPIENLPGSANDALAQNDDGYSFAGQCPDADQYFGVIGRAPDEGTWGYGITAPAEDFVYSLVVWTAVHEAVPVG